MSPCINLRGRRVCALDLKDGAVFHQGVLWDRFLYMTSPPHRERRHPKACTRLDTQADTHTRASRTRTCTCFCACVKRPLIWHLVKPIPLPKKAILFLDCLPEPCVWNLTAIWLVGSEKKNKQTRYLDDFTGTSFVYSSSERWDRSFIPPKIKLNKMKSLQVKSA